MPFFICELHLCLKGFYTKINLPCLALVGYIWSIISLFLTSFFNPTNCCFLFWSQHSSRKKRWWFWWWWHNWWWHYRSRGVWFGVRSDAPPRCLHRLDRRSTRSLYTKLAALWPLQLLPRLLTPQTCRTIAEVKKKKTVTVAHHWSLRKKTRRKWDLICSASPLVASETPFENAWIWIMSIFLTDELGQ